MGTTKTDRMPELTYDAQSDVLYVKLRDAARIVDCEPIDGDDFVVLNRDAAGRIVGLQLLYVCEMSVGRWVEHFRDVPGPLFEAVEGWLRAHADPSRADDGPSA